MDLTLAKLSSCLSSKLDRVSVSSFVSGIAGHDRRSLSNSASGVSAWKININTDMGLNDSVEDDIVLRQLDRYIDDTVDVILHHIIRNNGSWLVYLSPKNSDT